MRSSWPVLLLFCGWILYDRFAQPDVVATTPPAAQATAPAVSLAPIPATITAPRSPAEAKLDKLVAWDLEEAPLAEAIAYFSKDLGLPINLDRKSLDEYGLALDSPISFRIEGVRARTALQLFAREHHLSLQWLGEGLLLRSEADTSSMELRIYPVRDLVQFEDDQGVHTEFDSLLDAITTSIAPETWKEMGTGEGTVTALETADSLAIRQNPEVHDQIAELLANLRAARQVQGIQGPVQVRRKPWLGGSFGGGVIGGGGFGGGGGGFGAPAGRGFSGGGLSGGGFF